MVSVVEATAGSLHTLNIQAPLVTKAIDIGVAIFPRDLYCIMVRIWAEVDYCNDLA